MGKESHLRTIGYYFIAPLVGLLIASFVGITLLERVSLRPLAERLGTDTSKAEIVERVTQLLKEREGASRAKVHEFLHSLGGEVTYRNDSPRGDGLRESAYWILADTPGPLNIRAVWILYYDPEDRLTRVVVGDSFP